MIFGWELIIFYRYGINIIYIDIFINYSFKEVIFICLRKLN
jgi:hypothetical protein